MALSEHQKRSRAQEKLTAAQLAGRTTPGSGNTPVHGNDVLGQHWSVENKTTVHDSYRLSLRVWREVVRNALLDGREPVLQIDIQGVRLAVVDWNHLIEMAGGEE